MLSLHTNQAVLSAQAALDRNTKSLSTAQTRLSTGYRVNSAADDAAGLQVATRLRSLGSGMAVAMRNTQNSMSMLQTADAAIGDASDMLVRLSDLAVQAADVSGSQADRDALNAEYLALSKQIMQAVNETPYGGSPLIRYTVSSPGTLGQGPMTFQVGASAEETVTADFRYALGWLNSTLYFAIDGGNLAGYPYDGAGTELTSTQFANALVDKIADAIDAASEVRSQLGAVSNQLQTAYNNLASMQQNTSSAEGRIMDADFASDSASMAQQQLLTQASTSMLKQANSMSQLVMSLVQS